LLKAEEDAAPPDNESRIAEPQHDPVVSDCARPARLLPTWFVTGLAAAVVWCATAGVLGIFLLITGWYAASVVGGVASIASVAGGVATRRGLGERAHVDHVAALAAVGLATVFFVGAAAFHSEHLLIDRDPAGYITTGRSIARTHELKPKIQRGAFTGGAFGTATYGRYDPNFFPMLPVLLAMGWSVGGDTGLLLVPAALGALGVCACFALASRVVSPRAALLALAVLILAPLQLWFARDAYSELVVQVVVLGGLWLYLEARARARCGIALLSGFVVASSALARIDALGIVTGALVVVAVQWVGCDSDATPVRARRVVCSFGCSLVGGTLIALGMSYIVASNYIHSLGAEYVELVVAFGAAVIGVVAVVGIHRTHPGLGRWLAGKKYLFVGGVAAFAALFAWAYVWRPDPTRDLPVFTSSKQITPALRNAWNNWHFSWSLHWFSAYFGLAAIVAAFVGLVILASRARRGNGAAAAVFFVVVPVAVAYIARPSITPDQPWAMRRYLPVVIPGIAIAVAVVLATAWRAARSLRRPLPRVVAVLAVVVAVLLTAIPIAAAAVPFARARAQHGAEAAVHHICEIAGDDGAVLVFGPGLIYIELHYAVWAFCGVPVGRSSAVDVVHVARQWHELGRRLIVATAAPDLVRQRAPNGTIVGHLVISDDDDPERVFERAPRRFKPSPREIWLFEIPANPS
jgi:hypothetical protein